MTDRRARGVEPVFVVVGGQSVEAIARAHSSSTSTLHCQVGRAVSRGLGSEEWVNTTHRRSRRERGTVGGSSEGGRERRSGDGIGGRRGGGGRGRGGRRRKGQRTRDRRGLLVGVFVVTVVGWFVRWCDRSGWEGGGKSWWWAVRRRHRVRGASGGGWEVVVIVMWFVGFVGDGFDVTAR
jgi:hypothetical protein